MEVVKEYIDYIKDKKRLSNNTVSSYYIDIKKYINYLNSINLELNDVVENDIIGYIINLEKENVSVATVSRMISSIKSFHDYLFLNHIINNNPAKTIKKPKIEKQEVDILTEEEIGALLKFPKLDTPKLIRDKAIFEVLYGTGIKVSELVDMDIDNVDLELDYIYCNISKNKRVIPLSDITKTYLEKYIKEARLDLTDEDEKALFNRLNHNEKHHSIRVCKDALDICKNKKIPLSTNRIAKAALLHDVGKGEFGLNLVEKSTLVLLNNLNLSLSTHFLVYYQNLYCLLPIII